MGRLGCAQVVLAALCALLMSPGVAAVRGDRWEAMKEWIQHVTPGYFPAQRTAPSKSSASPAHQALYTPQMLAGTVEDSADVEHGGLDLLVPDVRSLLSDPREQEVRERLTSGPWRYDCAEWEAGIDRWLFTSWPVGGGGGGGGGTDGQGQDIELEIRTERVARAGQPERQILSNVVRLSPTYDASGFAGFVGRGPVSFESPTITDAEYNFTINDRLDPPVDGHVTFVHKGGHYSLVLPHCMPLMGIH